MKPLTQRHTLLMWLFAKVSLSYRIFQLLDHDSFCNTKLLNFSSKQAKLEIPG